MHDVLKLFKYRIQCFVGLTVAYLKFKTKMIYGKNSYSILKYYFNAKQYFMIFQKKKKKNYSQTEI